MVTTAVEPCETAEEVQARLAWRALAAAAADEEGGCSGASLLHRRLRAEVDDGLKGGLDKRLKRLEQKLLAARGAAAPPPPPPVQASPQAPPVMTEALEEVLLAALRTAKRASVPPRKVFGPTKVQTTLLDPPEKRDDAVRECVTLHGTLGSLEQTLSNREKQIQSLSKQLSVCQDMLKLGAEEAASTDSDLSRLERDPDASSLTEVHERKVARRRTRRNEIAADLEKAQRSVRHHKQLSEQQRAFFLQKERIAGMDCAESLARHPTGDLALWPKPPPMTDEPEVWDVGTAYANPYVTDSWPFEPNVQYRRSPQVPFMQPHQEETARDLAMENLGGLSTFERRLRQINMEREEDDDAGEDDEEERYRGPAESSRSV